MKSKAWSWLVRSILSPLFPHRLPTVAPLDMVINYCATFFNLASREALMFEGDGLTTAVIETYARPK